MHNPAIEAPPRLHKEVDELPPYNHDARCPKCLHDGVKAVYCELCGEFDSEHLKRICRECGYFWREQCADTEDSVSLKRYQRTAAREKRGKR